MLIAETYNYHDSQLTAAQIAEKCGTRKVGFICNTGEIQNGGRRKALSGGARRKAGT